MKKNVIFKQVDNLYFILKYRETDQIYYIIRKKENVEKYKIEAALYSYIIRKKVLLVIPEGCQYEAQELQIKDDENNDFNKYL